MEIAKTPLKMELESTKVAADAALGSAAGQVYLQGSFPAHPGRRAREKMATEKNENKV